jgi:hypothetical protein
MSTIVNILYVVSMAATSYSDYRIPSVGLTSQDCTPALCLLLIVGIFIMWISGGLHWHVSVGIVTRLRARRPENEVSIPVRSIDLSLDQSVHTGSGDHPASCPIFVTRFATEVERPNHKP